MDLVSNTYKPYIKPNNTIKYVHRDSNHPPSILKNIPTSINRRLSSLSSSELMFNEIAPHYQQALQKSGYNFNLTYAPQPPQETRRKNRQRKIIYYNPPYTKNLTTNIGKEFFKLMEKHFPANHVLRPIINKNCVKISYSCLPNMSKIISSHNHKILKDQIVEPDPCTCNPPDSCPVEGNCGTKGIVYQAKVTTQTGETSTYVGLSSNSFITRYRTHRSNFTNLNQKSQTTLSTKIRNLNRKNVNFELEWRIIKNSHPYKAGANQCRLCLEEIYWIIFHPADASLNSRKEFMTKCRHQKKFLLSEN